jgi:hypothetical protein
MQQQSFVLPELGTCMHSSSACRDEGRLHLKCSKVQPEVQACVGMTYYCVFTPLKDVSWAYEAL